MENNLIDRQILGQLADNLIAEKYGGSAPAGVDNLKNQLIDSIDNRISSAIFGSLTLDARQTIYGLLKDPSSTSDTFLNFFKNQNIDLEKTITDTMSNFKAEFLGGQNA